MSNKITYSDIEKIIDGHFEADRNFMFVVDRDTAEYIVDYLNDVYGCEDEVFDSFEDVDVDEFFITAYFDRDEDYSVYCECARGNSGRYKYSDIDHCDYFILDSTGMCDITANKVLLGDGCTKSWFEIVDEDEDEYFGEYGECVCDGDCECCECEETDDVDESEQEEFRLIGETIAKIFDVYPCPDCVADAVIQLAYMFRDIGWVNHQDYIREMNED